MILIRIHLIFAFENHQSTHKLKFELGRPVSKVAELSLIIKTNQLHLYICPCQIPVIFMVAFSMFMVSMLLPDGKCLFLSSPFSFDIYHFHTSGNTLETGTYSSSFFSIHTFIYVHIPIFNL